MNIWLIMIAGGLITFGMRFSLIYLFGKFEIPQTVQRALHYVPPAVLSAIIFPELFYPNDTFDISWSNTQLLAGLIAIAVAWFSKNTLLTIIVGMIVLLIINFL
jgi:branched-subunit amino acid transport protein